MVPDWQIAWQSPATTNEGMRRTAPTLVRMVTDLVKARLNEAKAQELGGDEAVRVFFESVKVRVT
jgi:hypothetical protein